MKSAHGPVRLGLSMAEIRESTIQAEILQYLRWRRIPAWSTHSSRNRPETPGMADILGVLPGGRFLAIECKAEAGKASELQLDFMASVNAVGGLAFVARSVEDVQRAIDAA